MRILRSIGLAMALWGCGHREHAPAHPATNDPPASDVTSSEAYVALTRLQALAEAYHRQHGSYPEGMAPLTPATACCEGTGHLCPPDPLLWAAPPWNAFPFSIDTAQPYQYSYVTAGAGTSFVAIATGDLDCDSVTVDFTLACATVGGAPNCVITSPPTID